jgi:hypothetical protein
METPSALAVTLHRDKPSTILATEKSPTLVQARCFKSLKTVNSDRKRVKAKSLAVQKSLLQSSYMQ